jgi:D-sedoheptulose 7-phosphate isomerase
MSSELQGAGDMREQLNQYFGTLSDLLRGAQVTDRSSKPLPLDAGCQWVRDAAHEAHNSGNKVMFIGNGGSASIASHLAIDFSKNGGLRALAFNDPSALICLGNDLGYENVFAKQLDFHARSGDLLIAISRLRSFSQHPRCGKDGANARMQSGHVFRIRGGKRASAHRRRQLLRSLAGIRLRRSRAPGAVPRCARHRYGLGPQRLASAPAWRNTTDRKE